MKYRIIKPEDFVTGVWSGGTTTQIAIYPEDASYDRRNFVFRLSSATVDTDRSEFTHLPDYDRWLMILEGSARLVYGNDREISLRPYECDAFDGGENTVSYGQVTDYNLMLQKGGEGFMEAVGLDEKTKKITLLSRREYRSGFAGVFLRGEYAHITVNGEQLNLKNGWQLLLIFEDEKATEIELAGSGIAVVAQGVFSIMK